MLNWPCLKSVLFTQYNGKRRKHLHQPVACLTLHPLVEDDFPSLGYIHQDGCSLWQKWCMWCGTVFDRNWLAIPTSMKPALPDSPLGWWAAPWCVLLAQSVFTQVGANASLQPSSLSLLQNWGLISYWIINSQDSLRNRNVCWLSFII